MKPRMMSAIAPVILSLMALPPTLAQATNVNGTCELYFERLYKCAGGADSLWLR